MSQDIRASADNDKMGGHFWRGMRPREGRGGLVPPFAPVLVMLAEDGRGERGGGIREMGAAFHMSQHDRALLLGLSDRPPHRRAVTATERNPPPLLHLIAPKAR